MNTDIQKFFKENDYVVIRNQLTKEQCDLLYSYCKIKVCSADFKYTYDSESYNRDWDGVWDDTQALNTYSCYGDPIMESIMYMNTNSIQSYTGLNLFPNYSYWRFYERGNKLEKHKDRDGCEISCTIFIGSDVSNVDEHMYPEYTWPMWVLDKDGNELPIQLNAGDMIVYRGCDIIHWREPFIGLNHAQVFIHYSDVDNSNIKFDGRPLLAIPKKFQLK